MDTEAINVIKKLFEQYADRDNGTIVAAVTGYVLRIQLLLNTNDPKQNKVN